MRFVLLLDIAIYALFLIYAIQLTLCQFWLVLFYETLKHYFIAIDIRLT